MQFLEMRCTNLPYSDSSIYCGKELGGPSVDTITAHDYSLGPFVDLRYCPRCGVFYQVFINNLGSPPVMKMVPKDIKIDFLKIGDLFPFVASTGRRTLK